VTVYFFTELINFLGQNVIEIQANSDGFSVSRSGTVVINYAVLGQEGGGAEKTAMVDAGNW
jgi:hypothetical protein